MTCVYTIILNGWDYLRPPEAIEPGAQYICYTDAPMEPVKPWVIMPAYQPFKSASRNSRLPKILPHLHFDAEYSIYHDANFTLKRTPSQLIRSLNGHDIAMFEHPCRKHIEQEAMVILDKPEEFPTVDMEAVRGQVTRWKHHGAPMGLWAAGIIIRKHTPAIEQLNELWWREYIGGSSRDQLALPLARHQAGVEIETMRGCVFQNDLMSFHWHAAWKDKPGNREFETQRARADWMRNRLKEICKSGLEARHNTIDQGQCVG